MSDLLGREVAVPANERQSPGRHALKFDASGSSKGVYLSRLTIGYFPQTRQMAVVT